MSTRTRRIEDVSNYNISSDFEDDESDVTYISDSDIDGTLGRPFENGSYNGHYAMLVNHEIYQFLSYKYDKVLYSGPLNSSALNMTGELFNAGNKSVLGKRKRSRSIDQTDSNDNHHVAGVIWTKEEKDLFFELLSRKSRHRLPEIAREMGTKSLVEVEEYHDMLWEAAQHEPPIDLEDMPAAKEMSGDWIMMEENQGGSIQIVEEKHVHYSLDDEADELLLNMEFLENFLFTKYRRLMTISNSFVEEAESHLRDMVCTIMTVVAQWKLRQQRATIVPQLVQTAENMSNVVTLDEMQAILHDMGLPQHDSKIEEYEELRPDEDSHSMYSNSELTYFSGGASTNEDYDSDGWSDENLTEERFDEGYEYNFYDNIDPGIFMSDNSRQSSDPEKTKFFASQISHSSLASQVSLPSLASPEPLASPVSEGSYTSESSESSESSGSTQTPRASNTLDSDGNIGISSPVKEDSPPAYHDYDIIVDDYPSEDEESEIDDLLERETEILDYQDLKASRNEEKILTQWLLSGEKLPPYSEAQMHIIEKHLRKNVPTDTTASNAHAEESSADKSLPAWKLLTAEERQKLTSRSHFNLFIEST